MLIDAQTLLSDKQAVVATAFSTNAYSTGPGGTVKNNLGRQGLRAQFSLSEAFNNATSVTFEIGEADDAAGTNFKVLASSGAVVLANLGSGKVPFDVSIPDTNKAFIVARYTVAGTAPTTGKVTCALVLGTDSQRAYPGGYATPA